MSKPEFLDDGCTLSNKYCPNHYTGRKQCCPKDRCWYDEQKGRRQAGLRAYTTEAWKAQFVKLRITADSDTGEAMLERALIDVTTKDRGEWCAMCEDAVTRCVCFCVGCGHPRTEHGEEQDFLCPGFHASFDWMPPSGFERFFREQMSNPEFRAEYNKVRHEIAVADEVARRTLSDDEVRALAQEACVVYRTAAKGCHPDPCGTCDHIVDAITKAVEKGDERA